MAHILIVEDNELNRDMLSRRLERRGFEVSIAVDGQEGLDMIKSKRPDLVLMDMDLPIIDGWEATRQAKNDSSISAIPIIALTAHALAEHRSRPRKPVPMISIQSRLKCPGCWRKSKNFFPDF